jgi:Rrf2 family protein
MRVSAKVDYAVRAGAELAAAADGPVKGERIAQAQEIPLKFLENILPDLKHAGLVQSQRGAEGGYWLARPAEEISLADVIRAVEGPIASTAARRSSSATSGSRCEPTCAPSSRRSRSRTSRPVAFRVRLRGSRPTRRPGYPTRSRWARATRTPGRCNCSSRSAVSHGGRSSASSCEMPFAFGS